MFDQSVPGGLEQCLFAPMGQCPPCGKSIACILLVLFPFDGFGHKSVTLSLKTLVFQNTPACSSCLPALAQPSHVGPPLASGLVLASSSSRGRKMAARRPPETHQRILFGPHSVFFFFLDTCSLVGNTEKEFEKKQLPFCPCSQKVTVVFCHCTEVQKL